MNETYTYADTVDRKQKAKWLIEFQNPKQYVDEKLKMLRDEMYIRPDPEEIRHLRSLKTEGDIDRAVKGIINKHWS